jgi:hypothetical protein
MITIEQLLANIQFYDSDTVEVWRDFSKTKNFKSELSEFCVRQDTFNQNFVVRAKYMGSHQVALRLSGSLGYQHTLARQCTICKNFLGDEDDGHLSEYHQDALCEVSENGNRLTIFNEDLKAHFEFDETGVVICASDEEGGASNMLVNIKALKAIRHWAYKAMKEMEKNAKL